MPQFSNRSRAKLDTCDNRLTEVFIEVIKHIDCIILEGHREANRQNELYRSGKSKLQYPQSKHNSMPSKAVDAAPYPIDWKNVKRFHVFAGFVIAIGASMGYKIRWGGDWDMDWKYDDQSFHDLPHFEIVD